MLDFLIAHIYITLLTLFALALLILFEWQARSGGTSSVDAQEATQLMNKQQALVLDIRPNTVFRQGHIAGAVNLPLAELENKLKTLNKHRANPVIVVCQKGISAKTAAQTLRGAEFKQVLVLHEGMTGWLAAHYPVVQTTQS